MNKKANYRYIVLGAFVMLFSGLVGTFLPILFWGIPVGVVTIWAAFPAQAKNEKIENLPDVSIDCSVTKTNMSMG